MSNHRDRKLLDLAEGQACVNCGDYHGVVAAHSNHLIHGKGKGIKAHDCMHAWLCHSCHSWYDQGRQFDPTNTWHHTEKQRFFFVMMGRTVIQLWTQQLLKVAK